MPRKKVDERLRTLIENGVKSRHRSFVVIVGDRGRDQVRHARALLAPRPRMCAVLTAQCCAGGESALHAV